MYKFISPFLLITITSVHALSQPYQPTVDLRVRQNAERVTIRGKPVVYYELYITSFSSDTLQLKNLRAMNASDSSLLYSMTAEDWKTRSLSIGNEKEKNNRIYPGATIITYLEIDVLKSTNRVIHQLDIEVKGKPLAIQGALLSLSEPVVLGSPLKGGPWAAIYNPQWERGHRRVIYTVDGIARIPGRYAIDFILLNDQGQFANGNDNEIKNWFGYAKDVLAVKEGVVLSVRNDFEESATLSDHIESSADKAAGNYVSIDIGEGKVVFYEHLKPGSVKVKPGQKVRQGEVIASLGFTGQTTGPHLHFHVADTNSTLGAEGLPFEFEKFTSLGTYLNFGEFGKAPWIREKNDNHSLIKREMPASNSVIRF